MTALAAPRNTRPYAGDPVPNVLSIAVAAAVHLYPGALIAKNSSGYGVPFSATTGLVAMGRCEGDYDNTSGAAADKTAAVRQGVFPWNNSTSTDAITIADIGKPCFGVDDQTVAKTDANGTRSLAGIVIDVTSDGVFVLSGPAFSQQGAGSVNGYKGFVVLPIPDMSKIADGVIAKFTPKADGRIKGLQFLVSSPVTTAAKTSAVHPEIAAVAVTGGVCTITSALCTPIGAEVDATAITALNTFVAGQAITLKAATTTAFVEGSGSFILELG